MPTFRLVDSKWSIELTDALRGSPTSLQIVCPFIKRATLERLLNLTDVGKTKVITRFNLSDFADGVSDLSALSLLLQRGAEIRGVRNLHAKLYLFGRQRAIVTSANLTEAALLHNHELGFVADDKGVVQGCCSYFDDLWGRAGPNLTKDRLATWEEKITRHLAEGAPTGGASALGDEGVDAGKRVPTQVLSPLIADAQQAFVKFFGESKSRVPLDYSILEQVERAGCHWAATYPSGKRPRGVRDGALMFLARLTKSPDDIRVFGRAIGMRHRPVRDDATEHDIEKRSWKKKWPHYIRLHHAEFIAGTLANGISLNELMAELKHQSFKTTKRNAAENEDGKRNIDPSKAYRQQAAVELSQEGREWLSKSLEAAFAMHGKIGNGELGKLDWPALPE